LILQVTDAQILTGSVSRHVFFAHVRPSLAWLRRASRSSI
jgi:hypothetical protein